MGEKKREGGKNGTATLSSDLIRRASTERQRGSETLPSPMGKEKRRGSPGRRSVYLRTKVGVHHRGKSSHRTLSSLLSRKRKKEEKKEKNQAPRHGPFPDLDGAPGEKEKTKRLTQPWQVVGTTDGREKGEKKKRERVGLPLLSFCPGV